MERTRHYGALPRLIIRTTWTTAFAFGLILWSLLCAWIAGKAYSMPAPNAEVVYSALFRWNGANGQATQMRLTLKRVEGSKKLVALITEKNADSRKPSALCQVKSLEADTIDLVCKSENFGALAAPATLIIRPAKSRLDRRPAFVRFGTWLEGYKQAPLLVEADKLRS